MPYNDSFSSDDEEDQCPLCVEDMDVTDKSFKPCPCGFQICQFCYNNIRSGPEQYNRCPVCRRPYDDASIQYTTVTADDLKREQERKQRKEQERKQREREKNKEQTHHATLHGARDKKHLANMRVIQKNLVYVIGLNPSIPSEELQQMLRRDEFFGQYGKIQKIVINKRMNSSGHPGVGVYVTFARKEDAARCIAAVDGSVNDGKYLRAAYGTTKYCSSYLRGQNCPNPNCMFLHEPGEEADSFNRHHAPPGAAGSAMAAPGPSASASASASSAGAGAGSSSNPSSSGSLGSAGAAAASGGLQSVLAGREASSLHSSSVQPSPQLSAAHLAQTSPTRAPAALAAGGPPAVVAATTPALPAWGKAVPQIPPVQKITQDAAHDCAQKMLEQLAQNLATLGSSNRWSVEFVSTNETAKFPAMFSLPMDEKKRLKAYTKALADLDRLAARNASPAVSAEPRAAAAAPAQEVTAEPKASTPAASKKNNSQQLLAQLMKKPAEDSISKRTPEPEAEAAPKTVAAVADTTADMTAAAAAAAAPKKAHSPSSAAVRAAAPAAPVVAPDAATTVPAKLDMNKAVSLVSKERRDEKPFFGELANTLRAVGSELMQPAVPPSVSVPDDIEFGKSAYIDDGPAFDVHNLPDVPITGDAEPSVWSALEDFTRKKEVLQRKEKEFAAAKAQTKKRLKRMRV